MATTPSSLTTSGWTKSTDHSSRYPGLDSEQSPAQTGRETPSPSTLTGTDIPSLYHKLHGENTKSIPHPPGMENLQSTAMTAQAASLAETRSSSPLREIHNINRSVVPNPPEHTEDNSDVNPTEHKVLLNSPQTITIEHGLNVSPIENSTIDTNGEAKIVMSQGDLEDHQMEANTLPSISGATDISSGTPVNNVFSGSHVNLQVTEPIEPDISSSTPVNNVVSDSHVNLQVTEAMEPDDTFNDTDSAIGDGYSLLSSTSSIMSTIMKSREENGRTYHGYKDGKYVLPNDERENDRQDLQNHLCFLTFGHLSLAPLKNIHRVLDVGTGTGIWAIDFADAHPEAQVLGVDLSPHQPRFVPPNLVFEIDDLEETWTFSQKFDYIHSMMMTGAFRDWPRFFEQAFENLTPGGWCEIQDIDFPIQCSDNTLAPDSPLNEWSSLLIKAADILGYPLDACGHAAEYMADAGFVDIVIVPFQWPMNRWPKEKKYKEIGMWVMENFSSGLEAMSMALLTRALGWTREEVLVHNVAVRKDMCDTKIHAWWPLYVVYGRRP